VHFTPSFEWLLVSLRKASFFTWLSTQKKGSRRSTTMCSSGKRWSSWCLLLLIVELAPPRGPERRDDSCRSLSMACHGTTRPYPSRGCDGADRLLPLLLLLPLFTAAVGCITLAARLFSCSMSASSRMELSANNAEEYENILGCTARNICWCYTSQFSFYQL